MHITCYNDASCTTITPGISTGTACSRAPRSIGVGKKIACCVKLMTTSPPVWPSPRVEQRNDYRYSTCSAIYLWRLLRLQDANSILYSSRYNNHISLTNIGPLPPIPSTALHAPVINGAITGVSELF